MPRRAVGLQVWEDSIVSQAFRQFTKDNYAYIAIHGDSSGFKIFEDNRLKPMPILSLAKWIVDNKAYNGKTLVLLSCNDTLSSQKLTNTLRNLDKIANPKLAPRKVIGWDEELLLYKNGYIFGESKCKLYEASNTFAMNSTELKGANIPKGNPLLPVLRGAKRTPVVVLGAKAKVQLQAYNFDDWITKGVHGNVYDTNTKFKITEAVLEVEGGALIWNRWGDMEKSTPKQLRAADHVIDAMLDDSNIMWDAYRKNNLLIKDLEEASIKGTSGIKSTAIRKLPIANQIKELLKELLKIQ
jgi:hypothetical protein